MAAVTLRGLPCRTAKIGHERYRRLLPMRSQSPMMIAATPILMLSSCYEMMMLSQYRR